MIPASAKLEVSFIGYVTQVVSVPANGIVNVTLAEDSKLLDEVVVVGSRIEVGRHQHLVAVAPEPPRGLQPDPVTLRRRHLAGLEALVCVVG